MIAGWLRWLRGDVWDVVSVVPRQRARPNVRAERLELAAGLQRWADQLTRRRAAVVTRRWLLIALPAALLGAVVVLATGGRRPFWLIAVLAPACLGGVVALTHHVSAAQAARLLDRRLGLHDQLGTALELQAGPVRSGSLTALVLAEANQAVRTSVSTARVASRHAGAEWAGVAVAACGLALVIALPRHVAAGRPLALGPNSGGGAGAGAATRHRTPTPAAGARHPSSPAASLPKGIAPTRWAGAPVSAHQRARVTVSPPPASTGHRQSTGLSVISGRGVGSPAKLGGVGGGGRAGVSADAAGSSAGKADGSSPRNRGAAGAGPAAAAAKAAAAAAGAHTNPRGTPGGATAGTGAATVSHRLGVVPTLGGSRQLPLAASGSTPAAPGRTSARTGQSQTPDGGGGSGGRGGRAGAGPQAGTNFAPIPATSNVPSASDEDLLQSFFGTTDQLGFTGW